MATNVYGKVCAVFGGSRGIGRAVSEVLANRGGIVVVLSRDSDRAAQCVNCLRRATSLEQHLSLSCDVGCYTSVQNSLQHIQNKLGHVNVLVNAAGVNYDNLLLRTKPDEIQRTINTNLFGAMFTSQAVLKHMLRDRNGVIINIGSVVGMKGNIGQCVYAASKSGKMNKNVLYVCLENRPFHGKTRVWKWDKYYHAANSDPASYVYCKNIFWRVFKSISSECAVPEYIHTPIHGRSLQILRSGGLKCQNFQWKV